MLEAPPQPQGDLAEPPPRGRPGRPPWLGPAGLVAVAIVAILAIVVALLLERSPAPAPETTPPPSDDSAEPEQAAPRDEAPAEPEQAAPRDEAPAELPLRSDPDVLWMSTLDDDGWPESWGVEGSTAPGNAAVVRAPQGHGKAIRISNEGGGTDGDRWGFEARFSFERLGIEPRDEAYLRYYVWFPDDYEFDTEGKMPALQGVVPGNPSWIANSSLTCPSGKYKGKDCHDDRQFGTRTMWRNGGMITYLNVVSVGGVDRDTNRTDSGDNYNFIFSYQDAEGDDIAFESGWNYVEQHVKLNTPGEEDGVFEGWINGERGVRLTNVQYRTDEHEDLQINQWALVHFWGGPPTDYPERATHVLYDDIVISKAYVGDRTQ